MRKHIRQAMVALLPILLIVALTTACSLFSTLNDLVPQSTPTGGIPPTGGAPPTGWGEIKQIEAGKQGKEENAKFDRLLDEFFVEWVTEDTLSMHIYLAYPEAMNIERPVPTYGTVMSPELLIEEREATEQSGDRLATIQYDKLSSSRQITYDILSRNLELSKILEEKEDFIYYTGYVRPINGLQIQLPVVLAEFNFYTVEDIETYLGLLADTIRYFDDIIVFERERAARGYFMSDSNLETVIEQLEAFLEEREDTFILEVVDDKIDEFPGLSAEQRAEYKTRHRDLIMNNLLVAYDNLLEAMYSLKGVGPNKGGLAALPDGQRFAHAMLRFSVGTDMSVDELMSTIDQWRERTLYGVRMILANNTSIMEKYMDDKTGEIPDGTPEEYMEKLERAMQNDFPQIGAIDHSIREVHESLQEFISPAFFLTPPVDYFDNNVIYINPAKLGTEPTDNLDIFTALAHEGYPGHMYQMVYFRQTSPHPIRLMLSNTGYTEGWATYVEQFSYG